MVAPFVDSVIGIANVYSGADQNTVFEFDRVNSGNRDVIIKCDISPNAKFG